MSRAIRISLLVSAVVLFAACAGVGRDIEKFADQVLPDGTTRQIVKGTAQAAHEWTPAEERQLGRDMSAVLLGTRPLVKNAATGRYLNQVDLWIALQSDQPDLPWRFVMIDTPNLNAFAAPGGYIFITRGLFLRLHNEAELASVLGHEIGHVIRHHHVKAIKAQGGGNFLAGVVQAQIGKEGGVLASGVINFTKGLYSSGLDKADEFEADRIGGACGLFSIWPAIGIADVRRVLQ